MQRTSKIYSSIHFLSRNTQLQEEPPLILGRFYLNWKNRIKVPTFPLKTVKCGTFFNGFGDPAGVPGWAEAGNVGKSTTFCAYEGKCGKTSARVLPGYKNNRRQRAVIVQMILI